MSFFAVLGESDAPNFSISTCHLNLWALGGLFRRYVFLWDVGLRIKAIKDEPVTKVTIAIPFGTKKDDPDNKKKDKDVADLKSKMSYKKTVELIFGEEVKIGHDSIRYGDEAVKTIGLEITECNRDENKSDENFSLWNLKLSPPLAGNEEGYLRIRFRVRTQGRMWTKKRNGLFSRGALVDIRVSDVRETWNVKDGEALKARIVPLSKLYVFLILPSTLRHETSSPVFKYVRILEGQAWESYLDCATSFWKKRKMVVYYWKSEEVSTRTPFLAFLSLISSNLLRDYILYFLILFLLFWGIYSFIFYTHPRLETINTQLYNASSKYLTQIIVAIVSAGILVAVSQIEKVRKLIRSVKGQLHDIDFWVLRKRAK